jgi:hypothetical protein
MTQVISPTPGCIVWFYPAPHDGIATLYNQPLAAIVAGVHSDHLISLAIFDAYGNTQHRSNVHLVQPGEDWGYGAHATWMPHQISAAGIQPAQEPDAETPLPVIDTAAMFAETDGTSASEAGLVNEQITDSVAQSPAAGEAAPSSSEPAQA